MVNRAILLLGRAALLLVFCGIASALAGTGHINGIVADAKTGERLAGANVLVVGTGKGAVTDLNGRFLIVSLPPGSYTIRATFIGYKTEEKHAEFQGDSSVEIDFKLGAVAIEGSEVVVTAQAAGQNAAINQQLSSNQIVNVVSAAKIQELPDQNAAESVGRLPGVSVLRNGGEGTELVIRGLAPKYNQISVDGIQMSSSNPTDRSADLSGIASDMLGSIKVFKTVTPDLDANVIGGIVEFGLREARLGDPGTPGFNVLAQGGYKNLPDAYNKFNNYKYVVTAEERFLNDDFGVLAQVDLERENLTSNELGATYTHHSNSTIDYTLLSLNLYDTQRDIQRRNAALVLDYRLPEGKIKLTNFFGSGLSDVQPRQELFDLSGTNNRYFSISDQNGEGRSVTNGIEFENAFPLFQVNAKLSSAYSDSRDPADWTIEFYQGSAGLGQFTNQPNVDPRNVPPAANDDLSSTTLFLLSSNRYFSKTQAFTGSVDVKSNVTISDEINAEIKAGGSYRYHTRYFVQDVYDGGGLTFGGSQVVNNLIINHFGLPPGVLFKIPISYFTDPHYSYGTFLGGDYKMIAPLNYGMMAQMADLMRSSVQYIADNGGMQAYARDNYLSTTNNYSGSENQSALYLMTILNIGPEITLTGGVRYQDLRTRYTGARGIESRNSFNAYNFYDTTVTQDHGYFLPDVSLKYKPLPWFDIRLSYTNTLAYPDYNAIVPRIDVGAGAIAWNNYALNPTRSANFDASVSFYDNSIGLFTVGGFWKQIRDLIYPWTFSVSGANALQYFPPSLLNGSVPQATYPVNTYVNDASLIRDYGMELDWETHFWYLPGVFSGLVLGVNYTHIFSKAEYPYQVVSSNGRTVNYIDTSFSDRLLYQPNNIFNLSLGYDYMAFSARVSLLYDDNIFTGPNFWPQLRSYTAAYRRWDLSLKQGLPWFGVEVFGNLYNINSANDVSIIQKGSVPQSEQDYGMTGNLGLRVKF
jgi:TonB-dependent receptor